MSYKKQEEPATWRWDDPKAMKEAASHQLEVVTDATSSIGKGLKKSFKNYEKEAKSFARSLSDFVDLEDLLKSIHKVAHQDEHAQRKSSIVHTPIDWSKYPPSAFRKYSEGFSSTIEEEIEEEEEPTCNIEDDQKTSENLTATIKTRKDTKQRQYRRRKDNHINKNNNIPTVNELCSTQDENIVSVKQTSTEQPQKQQHARRQTAHVFITTQEENNNHLDPPRTRHHSLGVNHLKSYREYRCPSPRMGRK